MLTILLQPGQVRIRLTFVAVVIALAVTGTVSASIGGSSKTMATLRLVAGGALAMAFTYGVGLLPRTTGIAKQRAPAGSLEELPGPRRGGGL